MNILKFELRKLICSKILIFLLLLCLGLNLFIVIDSSYNSDMTKIMNGIIGEVGTLVNDDSLKKLDELYLKELDSLAEISPEAAKSFKETGGIEYSHDYYSKGLDKFEYKLLMIDSIRSYALSAMQTDREREFAEKFFEKIKNTDSKLTALLYVAEGILIADNDFERQFFAPINSDSIHFALFGNIMTVFFIEMLFLSMFITVRSYTYEFSEGISHLVYSSKQGRKLQRQKFYACIITVAAVFTVLGVITFGLYFILNDLKEILFIPVSATMYGGKMTVFDLNFIGLLLLCLSLGLAVSIISAASTYFVCGFLKNPFAVIGGYAALQAVCLLLPNMSDGENADMWDKLLSASPVGLVLNFNISTKTLNILTPELFCMTDTSLPLFEIFTVILWMLICLLFGKLSERVFARKEL